MTRFNRPNPDAWRCTETAYEQPFVGGVLRLELWETDDDQQWVLVVDDGATSEHAPVTDAMAAMVLRVMRHE